MSAPRSSLGLGSLLVAVLIVLAVGVGSAIAAIPNNGTYYACLTKSTGAVKVINYPKQKCATGQRLIKWGQQGPSGATGAQGPQGPLGPQGPKGDAGITKITLTTVFKTESPVGGAGTTGSAIATCPAGAKLVGGGFSQANTAVETFQSRPEGVNAWAVWWAKEQTGDHPVTAYAICMTTDPSSVIASLSPAAKKAIKQANRSGAEQRR